MSKTVRRIVTHITTLRSQIQQISAQGQVLRRTITTVITDTWTLVWAEEDSMEYGVWKAEEGNDPAQFMLGKEENIQQNGEDRPATGDQRVASEPPVDAAPASDA